MPTLNLSTFFLTDKYFLCIFLHWIGFAFDYPDEYFHFPSKNMEMRVQNTISTIQYNYC